jgi:hypothetical protein
MTAGDASASGAAASGASARGASASGAAASGALACGAAASGGRDFDFFLGQWRVMHRKLKERLRQSREWIEFGGTVRVRPILGGLGNFDENVLDSPQGRYEACTLRLFDPQAARWAIYWIDGRVLTPDPPLFGTFRNGVGTFLGDDVWEGRSIKVRFFWTPLDANHCRWEQAFSPDGGQSWETNWIMEFHRQ